MARKIRTKSTNREESTIYLEKAEQFIGNGKEALQKGDLITAGLLAIHSAISAADALIIYRAGMRSTSPDHSVVVRLIGKVAPSGSSEWVRQANRLSRIVAKKNLVAYEARSLSRKEALYLVEQAERFLAWVREVITA